MMSKSKTESQPQLWLENQICFPLYATSRMVTKLYAPLLKELDLTYPQYLVLLVLWREDMKTVNQISDLLLLESNTLTPLLKRMEQKGIVKRNRSNADERQVIISLTAKGVKLQDKAACIPEAIFSQLQSDDVNAEEALIFKKVLDKLLQKFQQLADEA
ncbi:MarR family winged helix-turn-helix transcriptional regulator [Fulvivirga ligni]|uniref:MarR family winged helix-turn-helix transcriptional regulator n=1 Tax=Fulvivirga ligni TaxID=2904246 RepID=UPI001F45E6D7|nr:MarR family transcriptional regulator [Fulvivirga ligni]UII21487.1 MarR family transcriptional regulator [Fulvivirga ligni]